MAENMNYIDVLNDEEKVLNKVLESQNLLRTSVRERNWKELMNQISSINLLMDEFNRLDEKREEIASGIQKESFEEKNKLALVRGKLVRCRSENKSLSDYIYISKMFVQGVIEKALPQSRSKVYSKNGNIVQNKPQSVLVDTLY